MAVSDPGWLTDALRSCSSMRCRQVLHMTAAESCIALRRKATLKDGIMARSVFSCFIKMKNIVFSLTSAHIPARDNTSLECLSQLQTLQVRVGQCGWVCRGILHEDFDSQCLYVISIAISQPWQSFKLQKSARIYIKRTSKYTQQHIHTFTKALLQMPKNLFRNEVRQSKE